MKRPRFTFYSERNHHPEVLFGCWKCCRNGFQLFAGHYSVTVTYSR